MRSQAFPGRTQRLRASHSSYLWMGRLPEALMPVPVTAEAAKAEVAAEVAAAEVAADEEAR